MNNRVTKYDFYKEIREICANPKKLANRTLNKKLSLCIEKYDDMVMYYAGYYDKQLVQLEEFRKILQVLRTRLIKSQNFVLLLSEVSHIIENDKTIVVVLKNGSKVDYSLDFKYLLECL